jgi:hypothetical protein
MNMLVVTISTEAILASGNCRGSTDRPIRIGWTEFVQATMKAGQIGTIMAFITILFYREIAVSTATLWGRGRHFEGAVGILH